jgi:glutathione S-transferase
MLELADVPYDSVMYFSRETKEYKEYAPFGQMPLYRFV